MHRFPVPAQTMNLPPGKPRHKAIGSLWCATLSVAWIVFASACAVPLGQGSPDADGKQLYLSACASCHGVSGTGDGPVASALKTPVPDLTQLARKHGGQFPRTLVVETIAGERNVVAHGSREMPVWSHRLGTGGFGAPAVASIYAQRNIELLADYLASIQRPDR
jgi:hypothetical protein